MPVLPLSVSPVSLTDIFQPLSYRKNVTRWSNLFSACLDQVYDFQNEWKEYFSVRFLERYPLKSADYDTFPKFEYEKESFAIVFARLLPFLVGMFVLLLGVVLVPFVALRRYQVTAI